MHQVNQYIDRLIEDEGINNISEERKEELKDLLCDQYSLALAEALPLDLREEFAKLIEDEQFTYDDADRFYLTHGIDMQTIFSKVAEDFRQKLIGDK